MLVGELRGKVGVAPGTTTLYLPGGGRPTLLGQAEAPILTEDQYRAADIALRKQEVKIRRREVFWTGFAAFGSSTLTSLVLLGIVVAFFRTGKLKTPTN
jgi:hypothetical protein